MAKLAETSSTERKTSVPIPFRFKKPDGKDATTKFTISLDIYNYLISAFEDNEKEARKWLVSKAKMHKQNGVNNLSAYLREESLMLIIDGSLIKGYELDPQYHVISSSFYDENGKIAYIPINMPRAMMYALKTRGEDSQKIIDQKHRHYRNVKKSNPEWLENNLSESIRQDILADLIDPVLIEL